MSFKKLSVLVLLVLFCLTFSFTSIDKADAKFKKAKPFAGTFNGQVTQDPYTFDVTYKITQKNKEISGTIETLLNDQNVLPMTFTGTINKSGTSALITLVGSGGQTASDVVRIKLWNQGKKGVVMRYVNADTMEPIGSWINYKRIK